MTRVLSNGLILLLLIAPVIVGAEGYVRMVGLPFEPGNNPDVNVFVRALYQLAIGIAAALAVLRLILAGAQYILSDVITSKESAKRNIWSSLIGLLVVLSAVLILNTINPSLTQLNALSNMREIQIDVTRYRGPAPVADTTDALAEKAACEAKASEGYEYHSYGPAGNRTHECCITGQTCTQDTSADVGGIAISESKVYEYDEYLTLISELMQTGTLIDQGELLSNFYNEFASRCEQRSGTPHKIQYVSVVGGGAVKTHGICVGS